MEILDKLTKSVYDLFDLQEKQRETMIKLLKAFLIKEYKMKNPEKKHVLVARYHKYDLKTKKKNERPTYEVIHSDNHKRIQQLQKKFHTSYRNVNIESYNISHIKVDKDDKMLACLNKEISDALNNRR